MRQPIPASTTLAASGTLLVWEDEHRAGAVDLDHGTPSGDIWHDVNLVAVSPSGERVALATPTSIVVLRADGGGWSQIAEHHVADPPFRLAIDDGGVVVGVTAHDGPGESTAFLLDGGKREEQALGAVTAFTVLLDAPRRRVLLAGQAGRGSFHGGGEPFVRLYEWTQDGSAWSLLWGGPPPLGAPNGWLMPLAFGDIGVHDLDRLVVVSPDTNPDDVGASVDELALGNLETVVSSPDGGQVAWFWRDGKDDRVVHVRGARLSDGTVTRHPDVDGIDAFPAIAVADDGCVTLVDTVDQHTLRVRRLEDGAVDTSTYPLPSSA